MDHQEIEEQNIVDKYALGQLDGRKQQIFELHTLDCPQCQNDLELTLQLMEGMRHSKVSDLASAPADQSVSSVTIQKIKSSRKVSSFIQAIAATVIVASALIFVPFQSTSPLLESTKGTYTTLAFDTLRSSDNTHAINVAHLDSILVRLSVGAPTLDDNFVAQTYDAELTLGDNSTYSTQVSDDNWGDIQLVFDTEKLIDGPATINVRNTQSGETREYSIKFTKE